MTMLEADAFYDALTRALNDEEIRELSSADPEARLSHGALDSLRLLEILVTVEELAGNDSPPVLLPDLGSLADLYRYYCDLVSHRSPDYRGEAKR